MASQKLVRCEVRRETPSEEAQVRYVPLEIFGLWEYLMTRRHQFQVEEARASLWLDAEEETLFRRATRRSERPLLKAENPRATFSKILHERAPLYAQAADVRIDTTEATHDEVADLILQEIETRTAAKR